MNTTVEATIEADPTLPIIRITRDFAATPEQLFRAHTDPEIYRQWVGPNSISTTIDYWDARTGGSWRFLGVRDGQEYGFHGSFHEVGPNRIVLETLTFEDLSDGRTRLHAQSLVDSIEGRDAWLRSGMEVGVNEGYAKLDRMLADGAV
jgi:uncharacterized protein YndB with AHSA1/START domain